MGKIMKLTFNEWVGINESDKLNSYLFSEYCKDANIKQVLFKTCYYTETIEFFDCGGNGFYLVGADCQNPVLIRTSSAYMAKRIFDDKFKEIFKHDGEPVTLSTQIYSLASGDSIDIYFTPKAIAS